MDIVSLLYRGVLYVEVILYSKECNWYTRCCPLNGGVRYREPPLREIISRTYISAYPDIKFSVVNRSFVTNVSNSFPTDTRTVDDFSSEWLIPVCTNTFIRPGDSNSITHSTASYKDQERGKNS